ncbi:hypothetical protein N658DRAFT_507961 [Parathielavia hyrcaniae]|uniref:MARVEL domain-containing protein n=1 Tax=Parathielavia hyrcaniae TaxID=113614 RepID=A0AAN6Q1Y2_9PEZI|nr:hypothetical protein N658DRAFT_507961 [Parathielavia hyrcaniae]
MGSQGLLAVGVPPQPLWLLYIKIAVFVLSIIILALGAYSLSITAGYYPGGDPGGLDVFVGLFSMITYGGAAAIEIWSPALFYRIAALVLYILSIIFWLSAWAFSASIASVFLGSYYGSRLGGVYQSYGGALAGCAGLGAVVWVLTIVHLVFFIRACIMDTTAPGQAELGQVKPEAAPQQYAQQPYPVAQQPQQPYPQQPYPQQQPYPAQ